jgi:hypothetical protein
MINFTLSVGIWDKRSCDDPMDLRQNLTSILAQVDR